MAKVTYENFTGLVRRGTNALDWRYSAEVTRVTKGFFKTKREVVKIHRKYGSFWFFEDGGAFCFGNGMEDLERAHRAKENMWFE